MKVVRLSALHTLHLYPQDVFLVLISYRDWVDPRNTAWPEGSCQWEIPMTPSGIELATLRSALTNCTTKHRLTACTSFSYFVRNTPYITRLREAVFNLTFIGPCVTNIFAEYNQQDAKFLNLFISVRHPTCFRRVFLPSSGAQNRTYSVRYLSDRHCYLLLAWPASSR